MPLSRRTLISRAAQLGVATGVAELVAMLEAVHAAPQDRGPPVPPKPILTISPHVFMIEAPDGFPTPENLGLMSNIIFVAGRGGAVVVDSGASVQIAEMAIRQWKAFRGQPVVAVINT